VTVSGAAALSSTEAEITVMVEATKTAVFFRAILEELGLKQFHPTVIYNDNRSALTLAENYSGNQRRVRHMLPKVNWLMEQCRLLVSRYAHMPDETLHPDMHTKSLAPVKFIPKRDNLMGLESATLDSVTGRKRPRGN
jgi:hypothetical protein